MKTKARGEVAKVFFLVGTDAQKEPHPDATALRYAFADGKTTDVLLADIPPAMLRCAAMFGLKTKFRNSYADAASIDAAREAFAAQVEGVKGGSWNSGERGPSYAMLPDALAKVLGITREDAASKIAQREGEDDKAYRARLAKIASDSRVAKALIDLKPKGAEQDLAALMAA